jgi:hypothetical protein
MNAEQIRVYIRARLAELQKCLGNPQAYQTLAINARINELETLLRVIVERD